MKKYLCYYELHVEDRTFYVHTIISAESSGAALEQLLTASGKYYHLQPKGCLGEFTPELAEKYMGQYIPKKELESVCCGCLEKTWSQAEQHILGVCYDEGEWFCSKECVEINERRA